MNSAEAPTLVFDGGPRNGERVTSDVLVAVIGSGKDGGVYQQTDEVRDSLRVYRWQPLSQAETEAIVRGDIRANQEPER
jgi:hypothetical protein